MNVADESGTKVKGLIEEYCASPENNLGDGSGEPSWAEPLVGFASGADPIFISYKTHCGELHWTPEEIFKKALGREVKPEDLTVISWGLPQTAATKHDNAAMDTYPAERWARSRIFGEAFNVKLRSRVQDTLTKEGYAAIAPMLSSDFHREKSDAFQITSTWSERHIAHACGLGTFGLCDGLITPVGKALRFGSVVAEIRITPNQRPYTHHREYCLFAAEGTCGKCIDRCPAGALSEDGHDKELCRLYLAETTRPYVESEYKFKGYGCGLCQTGVPCESGIPISPRPDLSPLRQREETKWRKLSIARKKSLL